MSATGGLDCEAEGNDQTRIRTTFSGALQEIPRRTDFRMVGWYESYSFIWTLTLVSKMTLKTLNCITRKLVARSLIWQIAFNSSYLNYVTCYIWRNIFTIRVSYLITVEFLLFITLQFRILFKMFSTWIRGQRVFGFHLENEVLSGVYLYELSFLCVCVWVCVCVCGGGG
jgi:hypothetical protein